MIYEIMIFIFGAVVGYIIASILVAFEDYNIYNGKRK